MEQRLFSLNPTGGQCSADSLLTPRPPAAVSTSARQRRRQQREQQEELRRRERIRYDERSAVMALLLDAGTSMQLFWNNTQQIFSVDVTLQHQEDFFYPPPHTLNDNDEF